MAAKKRIVKNKPRAKRTNTKRRPVARTPQEKKGQSINVIVNSAGGAGGSGGGSSMHSGYSHSSSEGGGPSLFS